MRTPSRLFALLIMLSATLGVAHAQIERSGSQQQKFMQQYQQIAAEKTALQAQVTQMKQELDSAKAELASAKKERDALKAHAGTAAAAAAEVAQLTASKESAEKNLELYKQRTTEIVNKFHELGTNFRDVETDRNKVRAQLEERKVAYDKCAADNRQLFDITTEALNRYEHAGFFTKLGAAEPFTQLTRTRIQNIADEYRERAEENRAPAPPQ